MKRKRNDDEIVDQFLYIPEVKADLGYCDKSIASKSRAAHPRKCNRPSDHSGDCSEFHYLDHLKECAPKVRKKIIRDSTMTTGASWSSENAGPNRIHRWVMMLSDEELESLGINMVKLKPWIQAKLREKAATYDACMHVAQKLTWAVYGMVNAPVLPFEDVEHYLESSFGPVGHTTCMICKAPLDFNLFHEARPGKAEIETAHANPRSHSADNVGFAHRTCNIAQGNKSLDDFYTWIHGVLLRNGRI